MFENIPYNFDGEIGINEDSTDESFEGLINELKEKKHACVCLIYSSENLIPLYQVGILYINCSIGLSWMKQI